MISANYQQRTDGRSFLPSISQVTHGLSTGILGPHSGPAVGSAQQSCIRLPKISAHPLSKVQLLPKKEQLSLLKQIFSQAEKTVPWFIKDDIDLYVPYKGRTQTTSTAAIKNRWQQLRCQRGITRPVKPNHAAFVACLMPTDDSSSELSIRTAVDDEDDVDYPSDYSEDFCSDDDDEPADEVIDEEKLDLNNNIQPEFVNKTDPTDAHVHALSSVIGEATPNQGTDALEPEAMNHLEKVTVNTSKPSVAPFLTAPLPSISMTTLTKGRLPPLSRPGGLDHEGGLSSLVLSTRSSSSPSAAAAQMLTGEIDILKNPPVSNVEDSSICSSSSSDMLKSPDVEGTEVAKRTPFCAVAEKMEIHSCPNSSIEMLGCTEVGQSNPEVHQVASSIQAESIHVEESNDALQHGEPSTTVSNWSLPFLQLPASMLRKKTSGPLSSKPRKSFLSRRKKSLSPIAKDVEDSESYEDTVSNSTMLTEMVDLEESKRDPDDSCIYPMDDNNSTTIVEMEDMEESKTHAGREESKSCICPQTASNSTTFTEAEDSEESKMDMSLDDSKLASAEYDDSEESNVGGSSDVSKLPSPFPALPPSLLRKKTLRLAGSDSRRSKRCTHRKSSNDSTKSTEVEDSEIFVYPRTAANPSECSDPEESKTYGYPKSCNMHIDSEDADTFVFPKPHQSTSGSSEVEESTTYVYPKVSNSSSLSTTDEEAELYVYPKPSNKEQSSTDGESLSHNSSPTTCNSSQFPSLPSSMFNKKASSTPQNSKNSSNSPRDLPQILRRRLDRYAPPQRSIPQKSAKEIQTLWKTMKVAGPNNDKQRPMKGKGANIRKMLIRYSNWPDTESESDFSCPAVDENENRFQLPKYSSLESKEIIMMDVDDLVDFSLDASVGNEPIEDEPCTKDDEPAVSKSSSPSPSLPEPTVNKKPLASGVKTVNTSSDSEPLKNSPRFESLSYASSDSDNEQNVKFSHKPNAESMTFDDGSSAEPKLFNALQDTKPGNDSARFDSVSQDSDLSESEHEQSDRLTTSALEAKDKLEEVQDSWQSNAETLSLPLDSEPLNNTPRFESTSYESPKSDTFNLSLPLPHESEPVHDNSSSTTRRLNRTLESEPPTASPRFDSLSGGESESENDQNTELSLSSPQEARSVQDNGSTRTKMLDTPLDFELLNDSTKCDSISYESSEPQNEHKSSSSELGLVVAQENDSCSSNDRSVHALGEQQEMVSSSNEEHLTEPAGASEHCRTLDDVDNTVFETDDEFDDLPFDEDFDHAST